MDWKEIKIFASSEGLGQLTAKLSSIGIDSFSIDDPDEFKAHLGSIKGEWDIADDSVYENREASVKIYFLDNEQGRSQVSQVYESVALLKSSDSGLSMGSLKVESQIVMDEDWENSWKQHFKPIKVGNKLYICPAWDKVDDSEGRSVITVDPSSSFGSGQHETTQLCLQALESNISGGETVIDVGCGSGILSVAAIKLGASKVIAIDIDENATAATAQTAQLNGVDDKVAIVHGDLLNGVSMPADIIVANLFSNIIVRLSSYVPNVLKAGGLFIASGIIEDGLRDVLLAFSECGIKDCFTQNIGGWWLVCGRFLGGGNCQSLQ